MTSSQPSDFGKLLKKNGFNLPSSTENTIKITPHPDRDDIEILNVNSVFENYRLAQESGDPTRITEAGRHLDAAKALLKDLHEGLYTDTFPDPTERQSLEYWLDRLENDRPGPGGPPSEQFMLMGKNLLGQQEGPSELAAMSLRIYFPESESALAHYIFKDAKYGNRKDPETYIDITPLMQSSIANLENVASRYGKELKAIYCECDDPKKVDAHGSAMAPEKRLDIMKHKFGNVVLNTENYIQADLGNGTCDSLLLLTCATGDGTINTDTHRLKQYLNEYHGYFSGVLKTENVLDTPEGQKIFGDIEAIDKGEKSLLHPEYASDIPPTLLKSGVEYAKVTGQSQDQNLNRNTGGRQI